jgi:hypothetical protein
LASSGIDVIENVNDDPRNSRTTPVAGNCVNADKAASPRDRKYFIAVQNDAPDEEVIAFWLSVSYLEDHHVPMFVAKQ